MKKGGSTEIGYVASPESVPIFLDTKSGAHFYKSLKLLLNNVIVNGNIFLFYSPS